MRTSHRTASGATVLPVLAVALPTFTHLSYDRGEAIGDLVLPFEARQKTRQKTVLTDGREVGLKLPRGTLLRGGDILQSEDGEQIIVHAAPETVSRLTSSDPGALARAAYHLGNRHVWVQIGDAWVQYLHDHVLDDMLINMGFAVQVMQSGFEPEGGAYSHGLPAVHNHEH